MDATFLSELAAPRLTGTTGNAAARQRCADALRVLGFDVRESPFTFSAFPGRFGTPLIGALALGLVAVAGHWGARGARVLPLLVLFWGGLMLGAFGIWLGRHGVLRMRVMRRTGVNIEASRSRDVRVWLCAHFDSKSQPIPTLARALGIGFESAGVVTTVLLAVAAAAGIRFAFDVWVAAALVTLIGSIPVVLSVVGNRSAGALDNASGVATVLAAALELNDVEGVGVLLTDAEELGLAGAHAWAVARRGEPAVVLNCDGVDDAGDITIMVPRAPTAPIPEVIAAASSAARTPYRARRMPIGLLTDSVAFAQHGMASVTFSRGSWASLARVHSTRDDLSRLSGRGIPDVARLLSGTARQLVSRTINT